MKLDTSHMRYLTSDDWKVLTAVEIGSRNHEVVPTKTIGHIANLRGSSSRPISDLAKLNLISKLRNAKYDGYRLTYNGFDYLAMKAMFNRKTFDFLGTTIGVGKESDIYSAETPDGEQRVLKIHRLGRISFRTVKNKRDYLKGNQGASWMFLSRLAAEKEYEFMNILYRNGFNVPTPYDQSRHCVLMQRINGYPMRSLVEHYNPQFLYSELMKFIVKLANHGLIHCDFNEYNIMIKEDSERKDDSDPGFIVIDFPQCISIEHPDAEFYFQRDVECIRRFFNKKFNYNPKHDSTMLDTEGYGEGYRWAYPSLKRDVKRCAKLDIEVKASGFTRKLDSKETDDAFSSMRGAVGDDEENDNQEDQGDSNSEEEDYDEDENENDEDDYDSDDYEDDEEYDYEETDEEDNEQAEDLKEENEKIINALSSGVGNLKMDKLGNYILEE